MIPNDPEELKDLDEKVIIVCESLFLDYIKYIDKIKGIITSVGGLLTHTAILSKELKIPCIVNVNNAFEILKTGDFVRMDDNGNIYVKR